ncbi:MAG TPA: tripartite tricarboxylate transporter TctB family protein [Thermodesulfobacteriota bacterium]|nr:tripartite tricarboxylate transporter TctB family protein [Thermodesulfobacteriota bacterium]
MRIPILHRKDFSSGLTLLLVGLFLAFQSIRLPLWGASGPEAGFYPLILGVIIISLSFFLVLKSSILSRPRMAEKPVEQGMGQIHLHKVFAYLILVLLYGILVEKVGFVLTSALLLFLILKFVERQGWKATLAVGVASIVISYTLFVYFLQVPLPRGFLQGW